MLYIMKLKSNIKVIGKWRMQWRYIRPPDSKYVGTVHTSGRYKILVYCTATVIPQITVVRYNISVHNNPLDKNTLSRWQLSSFD